MSVRQWRGAALSLVPMSGSVQCDRAGAARRAARTARRAAGYERDGLAAVILPVAPGAACRRCRPLPGGFTALLYTSLLHYLDDPAPALREMVRVVDIDGRIVIGHLDRPGPPTSGGIVQVADSRRIITPLGPYRIPVLQQPPDPTRHTPSVHNPSTTCREGPFGGWGCWRMPMPPV